MNSFFFCSTQPHCITAMNCQSLQRPCTATWSLGWPRRHVVCWALGWKPYPQSLPRQIFCRHFEGSNLLTSDSCGTMAMVAANPADGWKSVRTLEIFTNIFFNPNVFCCSILRVALISEKNWIPRTWQGTMEFRPSGISACHFLSVSFNFQAFQVSTQTPIWLRYPVYNSSYSQGCWEFVVRKHEEILHTGTQEILAQSMLANIPQSAKNLIKLDGLAGSHVVLLGDSQGVTRPSYKDTCFVPHDSTFQSHVLTSKLLKFGRMPKKKFLYLAGYRGEFRLAEAAMRSLSGSHP